MFRSALCFWEDERGRGGILAAAGMRADGIDRVFLTGGTSRTPRIRRLFAERFGEERSRREASGRRSRMGWR